MSPALVQNTNEMDFLYPHDRECITLILPRADPGMTFVLKVMSSNEGLVFAISLVTFWVIRLILGRTPIHKWFASLIDTYGLYLAQMSIAPQNIIEKLLFLAIMISSIQISALLAGILFDYIIEYDTRKSITTIDELLESDLKILMIDYHFNTTLVEGWLSHVR